MKIPQIKKLIAHSNAVISLLCPTLRYALQALPAQGLLRAFW